MCLADVNGIEFSVYFYNEDKKLAIWVDNRGNASLMDFAIIEKAGLIGKAFRSKLSIVNFNSGI